MNKPLNEVIEELQVCTHNESAICPVLSDALHYLQEYQKYLKLTVDNSQVPEEQLLLPGMELVDKKTGRVLSEREAYDYISENPDVLEMFGPVRDYYSKHPEDFA